MNNKKQRMRTLYGYESSAIIAHCCGKSVEWMAKNTIGCSPNQPNVVDVTNRWIAGISLEGDSSAQIVDGKETRIAQTLSAGIDSQEIIASITPIFENEYIKEIIKKAVDLHNKAVEFEDTQKSLAKETYERRCMCCGELPDGTSKRQLCVDHIYPKSLGGPNHISNFQILCRSCNSRKRQDTTDYREQVESI